MVVEGRRCVCDSYIDRLFTGWSVTHKRGSLTSAHKRKKTPSIDWGSGADEPQLAALCSSNYYGNRHPWLADRD
ncbi:hypothetical protein LSTR_LSTR002761 [Laodelphax striatellus]|uniref:Uncharacterized protein n=1 Tax=Laodelphax striatellus TaxID=195883 RepID=A0A482WMB2_LAOST|nr:hypothetical protein LSTR_LSTR002761 [Laodelphax striatellus]